MALMIPENYDPHLTVRETQEAIKYIRDTFQKEFGKEMNLERISAPLFVEKSSGLNDNLNGVERPVQFDIAGIPGETVEVVHSLAKWKRMALHEYGFQPGEGLYTNMNAIRRDEELDNLHSCYVDQWDWEKVITKEDRTIETLKETVRTIFKIIKHMQHEVWYKYPNAVNHLPKEITFITSQELEDRYRLSCSEAEVQYLASKLYYCRFYASAPIEDAQDVKLHMALTSFLMMVSSQLNIPIYEDAKIVNQLESHLRDIDKQWGHPSIKGMKSICEQVCKVVEE